MQNDQEFSLSANFATQPQTKGGDEKSRVYSFFWALSDAQMQQMFPPLDGFWSKTTQGIFNALDPKHIRDVHVDHNWAWESQSWACPCCHRDKCEIAKVGKSGKVILTLAHHHDHARDIWDVNPTQQGRLAENFAEALICSDCNVAEANAKGAIGAEPWYSFSPKEVSSFIKVTQNHSHVVDFSKAAEIHQKVAPKVDLKLRHLKKTQPAIGIPIHEKAAFKHEVLFAALAKATGFSLGNLIWGFDCRSRSHSANNELHPERGLKIHGPRALSPEA